MGYKSWVLIALAVVGFASGAVDQYFYPGQFMPPSTLAATLVGVVLMFAWYRLDANQRGIGRTPFLDVGVVLLAIVALPIYFFRSRGAKGGFVASAVFLVAMIGYGVLGIAGQYATYYGLQA
ncbi:hypothetical protein LYSHEL_25980 [Lysobacter helvus]|uniref:Tripartite tricarboxylate transporter TctB family protein n=2 Tax=Lysobacteraceae TaxID=32033 RepID=A0ABN6FV63_9GAMM|nr:MULTISPECIES: hypothetical protein [Lysobacter]BCT93573.1 hypothetical protein LYSCAS_25970 [Lysobacter caseinilyticus]BCT96727.1 hypothetical protein LYSHEL_25980 [Lysobacter helvus]